MAGEIDSSWSGKRVVVLGGSSGIGLAVAQLVAARGAEVVIGSSSNTRLGGALESLGERAKGRAIDLLDERAIENFFDALETFDHLVFTAGDKLALAELATTDLAQARHAFELRYWGAVAAVKYGNALIRDGGSIVLTSGIAGQRSARRLGSRRERLRGDRRARASRARRGAGAAASERRGARAGAHESVAKHAGGRPRDHV